MSSLVRLLPISALLVVLVGSLFALELQRLSERLVALQQREAVLDGRIEQTLDAWRTQTDVLMRVRVLMQGFRINPLRWRESTTTSRKRDRPDLRYHPRPEERRKFY